MQHTSMTKAGSLRVSGSRSLVEGSQRGDLPAVGPVDNHHLVVQSCSTTAENNATIEFGTINVQPLPGMTVSRSDWSTLSTWPLSVILTWPIDNHYSEQEITPSGGRPRR